VYRDTVWARLLAAPALLIWWQQQIRPTLVARYRAVVDAMDPAAVDFCRCALAWDPADRLAFGDPGGDPQQLGGCWRALRHMLFEPLRAWPAAADAVADAVVTKHVYYQCHVTPALRWMPPPGMLKDTRHRQFLADAQTAARQLVADEPILLGEGDFARFVCSTAVRTLNMQLGLS
jgi:hypothetical protein